LNPVLSHKRIPQAEAVAALDLRRCERICLGPTAGWSVA
jgi:hypothetical protein